MKIAWESQGDGAPLLLIQGLGYARWGWEPVVPRRSPSATACSRSTTAASASPTSPPGPYTAREMADDALQVLDEAGVERAHVLGASLGGMIAQELAVAAPERVDKLVLCCTTPGGAGRACRCRSVTVQLFAEAATLAPEVALRRFVENALGAEPPAGARRRALRAAALANPPDPAGWQAQAAAGTTFAGRRRRDRGADARRARARPTTSSTRATRTLLAERIAGARVELLDGRRAPVLLGAARRVRQDRRGVPRMSAAHDRPHRSATARASRRTASRSTTAGATWTYARARRALRRARARRSRTASASRR